MGAERRPVFGGGGALAHGLAEPCREHGAVHQQDPRREVVVGLPLVVIRRHVPQVGQGIVDVGADGVGEPALDPDAAVERQDRRPREGELLGRPERVAVHVAEVGEVGEVVVDQQVVRFVVHLA